MYNRSEIKNTVICAILLMLISSVMRTSCWSNGVLPPTIFSIEREAGYEHVSDANYTRILPCINNITRMELCMRCAKETKSPYVYPECCNEEDNITPWCYRYVYYGREPGQPVGDIYVAELTPEDRNIHKYLN